MDNIINLLTHFIIGFINKTGYWGIFLLMTAESALIPIPSEVTMPFAGFLATLGRFSVFWVILVGALGNLVGSLIAYGLGYYLEEHIILNLIGKFGKFILLSKHEYERAVQWFKKYGNKITFWSRLLPVVRTFISLPAGLAEMNIWQFSAYTLFGSLLWSAFLTYIGFALGRDWHSIEPLYRRFEYAIVGVAIIVVFLYILHKLRKRKPR